MVDHPIHKPQRMEFIQQCGKSDCGIACVAMLIDCLYKPSKLLFKEFGKNTRGGLYPEDIFEVLEDIGFGFKELKKLPTNGRALVAIQWKDQRLSGHFVVWDSKRKQFMDPLYGVFGKTEFKKHAKIEGVWKIYRRRK